MRRNPFHAFRRNVEQAETGIVPTPPALEDTDKVHAATQSIEHTDRELIDFLQRELVARDTTIARLQEQLLARPAVPAARAKQQLDRGSLAWIDTYEPFRPLALAAA